MEQGFQPLATQQPNTTKATQRRAAFVISGRKPASETIRHSGHISDFGLDVPGYEATDVLPDVALCQTVACAMKQRYG